MLIWQHHSGTERRWECLTMLRKSVKMDVIRFYESTKKNYVEESRFWSKSKAIFN